MAMAEKRDDFDHLDRLLDATARPVSVSETLLQRVLADADRVDRARRPVPFGQQIREAVGGWSGFGGLIAASLTGVWIGFAPPAMLPDPASLLMGTENPALSDVWETGVFDTVAILEEG